MPRFSIIPLTIALLSASCGPVVSSARFSEVPLPPTSGNVAIFSTKAPTCAYDEIGLVQVHRQHGFTDLQTLIDALRARAREMGGTAVLGVGLASNVNGTTTDDHTNPPISTDGGLSGIVVRFRDPACRE